MPESDTGLPRAPESRAVARKRTHLSLVWLIPIVAAVAGAWVAVTRILAEGPEITIVFASAEGLEAGKTKIEYNGVQVGTVTGIRLSDDHRQVITTAQMAPKSEDLLLEDTKFWVVRPRISGATITGLGTLVSGAYIGLEIGVSKKSQRHFDALETPPVVAGDTPGRFFVLKTDDLGSLDTGTPLYFRRLKVGEVASYQLDADGRAFSVKAFVNAPYDQYVTSTTRFLHASGVDVSLSASGLSVQTQSVLSILIGGIAFETPATGPVLPAAAEETVFTLFEDREAAFRPAARDPQTYRMVFTQSVRGLAAGAPVEFRGIPIGEVVDVTAQIDPRTFEFSVPVTVSLDAERLGVKVLQPEPGVDLEAVRRKLVDTLVSRGVRAQLRTGNLLTGALYVALDFFPNAAPAKLDWSQHPVQLPTTPGELEAVEASVVSIIKKLDEIPYKEIGVDLRKAIVDLDHTLVSARGTFDNANTMIEPNSVLGQQLDSTLQEVSGAARGLRILMDYLERHPEALVRGKTGEAK
ncbi:MAG: MCE family protein [Myxococcales bacterium]|nr:MAG: MCE family protein [Myxococcales bacterium]